MKPNPSVKIYASVHEVLIASDKTGKSLDEMQKVTAQKPSLDIRAQIDQLVSALKSQKVTIDQIIDKGFNLFPNLNKAQTIIENQLESAKKLQAKISMDYTGLDVMYAPQKEGAPKPDYAIEAEPSRRAQQSSGPTARG